MVMVSLGNSAGSENFDFWCESKWRKAALDKLRTLHPVDYVHGLLRQTPVNQDVLTRSAPSPSGPTPHHLSRGTLDFLRIRTFHRYHRGMGR